MDHAGKPRRFGGLKWSRAVVTSMEDIAILATLHSAADLVILHSSLCIVSKTFITEYPVGQWVCIVVRGLCRLGLMCVRLIAAVVRISLVFGITQE